MSDDLTKERASKTAAYIVAASLVPIVTGAILVSAPVISIGALGVALAAVVKLRNEPKGHKSTFTPTDHPMRRAEDRKGDHVGV
jgi:uncharacterized membrane protein